MWGIIPVMSATADRVREIVATLPEPLQRQVLEYARQLSQSLSLRGIPLGELQKMAGLLSDEEANAILNAIESAFEQVDPNEW